MIAHLTEQFRFYTLPVDQIQPTSWPNGCLILKKKEHDFLQQIHQLGRKSQTV